MASFYSPRNFPHKKPSSLQMRIIGPLLLLVCIALIWVFNTPFINKEIVEKNLEQLAQTLAQQAQANGKDAKLTYGAINIEGFALQKYAVIENLNLAISDKAALDSNVLAFSTAKVLVKPEAFSIQHFYFTFPEPLNISQNNELKSVVSFSAAPVLSYFNGVRKQIWSIEQSLLLPEQITITPAKSPEDTNAVKTAATIVNVDKGAVLYTVLFPDSKERKSNAALKNIKISGEESIHAMIGAISASYEEKQINESRIEGKYILNATDILILVGENEMKPYNVSADIHFNTNMPKPLAEGEQMPADAPDVAEIIVNSITLLTSDFETKIDGKVAAALNDPLLFGSANVEVKNAGNLLSSELVPQQLKGPLRMALQKIIGQPVEADTHFSIPLKREKNGVFYIGTNTFEEIAASLFTDLMQNSPPPPAIEPPPPPAQRDPLSDATQENAAPVDSVLMSPWGEPEPGMGSR